MNELRMDLKVCEGCGTLWLRAGLGEGVYCRGCARTLAEFPAAKGSKAMSITRIRRAARGLAAANPSGGAR